MKKLKFVLGSAAFLIAVGGAFAGKTTNTAPATQTLYDKIEGPDPCSPSPCTFVPNDILCQRDVYTDNGCSNLVTEDTFRPDVN